MNDEIIKLLEKHVEQCGNYDVAIYLLNMIEELKNEI